MGIGQWLEVAYQPDACHSSGTSFADRYGCPDADADAWSDPGETGRQLMVRMPSRLNRHNGATVISMAMETTKQRARISSMISQIIRHNSEIRILMVGVTIKPTGLHKSTISR